MIDKNFSVPRFDYLKPHDIVDVIAPASRCEPIIIDKIKQFLATWQLECRIPNDLFGDDLFCSNSNEVRFRHLQDALFNSTSKAIWCLRGGYGSMKLIPELLKISPPQNKKIFIGSSDITALHIFLQDKWKWPTIHGPSLQTAAIDKVSNESLNLLKNVIFKNSNSLTLNSIVPLNKLAEKSTSFSAKMTGGNLCLIQASLGTSWQINTNDKILLIEEVNERGYRIDRMLEQLKQANIISHAQVILFGDLLGGEEPDGKSLAQDAIKKFADDCHIPVLQMTGVGHGTTNNPVILGSAATLHTGKEASLTFNLS